MGKFIPQFIAIQPRKAANPIRHKNTFIGSKWVNEAPFSPHKTEPIF